jgi:hypothetical protein
MRYAWMSGLAAIVLGALQPAPPVQTPVGDAGSPQVVLVELFTSEGCSSCPPADRMLRQMDGKRTPQGALVVGVSEHVTYWDHDGWKDPYGSEVATERQHDYGDRFRLDSVYTPQMVVNGEAQFVGGNAKALGEALDRIHVQKAGAVKIESVKVDGDVATVTVALGDDLPPRGADLVLVTAEDETTARVLGGENSGKTLEHASVARTMQRVNRVRQVGESTYVVKLAKADAGTKRHLIVWLQEPGLARVLGVDSRAF